jgi:hypothetical protein
MSATKELAVRLQNQLVLTLQMAYTVKQDYAESCNDRIMVCRCNGMEGALLLLQATQ